jgi:hypothetical protein
VSWNKMRSKGVQAIAEGLKPNLSLQVRLHGRHDVDNMTLCQDAAATLHSLKGRYSYCFVSFEIAEHPVRNRPDSGPHDVSRHTSCACLRATGRC